MKRMTEAEQIAAVCEWWGLKYPTSDITTHEDYDPVIWWSREGCWKALEAWATTHQPIGTGGFTVEFDGSQYRVHYDTVWVDEDSSKTNWYETFPAAALAALTEAMEHE